VYSRAVSSPVLWRATAMVRTVRDFLIGVDVVGGKRCAIQILAGRGSDRAVFQTSTKSAAMQEQRRDQVDGVLLLEGHGVMHI